MTVSSHKYNTIDWLRGLLAVCVMLYHLISWIIHPLDSSSFLGVMGIYAVSMFFTISGFSIACAYLKKMNSFQEVFYFI